MLDTAIQLAYLAASVLFILGLKGLAHPDTARRGRLLAELGMLMAVVGTLLKHEIVRYRWIIAGVAIGGGAAVGASDQAPLVPPSPAPPKLQTVASFSVHVSPATRATA